MRTKNQKQIDFALSVLSTETDDCIYWPFKLDEYGYGVSCSLMHRKAHRALFQMANGCLDPSLVVMHACDNRACVNPRHLKQGTHSDNFKDMHSKGRASHAGRVPQLSGSAHGKSVLTEAQVALMRANPDNVSHAELARRFGVGKATVHDIVHFKTWKHV